MNLSKLAHVIETVAEQDAVISPPSVLASLRVATEDDAERIAHAIAVLLGGTLRWEGDCKAPHYAIDGVRDVSVAVHYPREAEAW